MRSSLSLQMLLYLGTYFTIGFVMVEIALVVFKCAVFPYPSRNIALDLIILLALSCLETLRIFYGRKGNLIESSSSLISTLVFTVPCVVGVVYFLLWQTYVLRLEVILCSIFLAIQTIQTIFLAVTLVSFWGKN